MKKSTLAIAIGLLLVANTGFAKEGANKFLI